MSTVTITDYRTWGVYPQPTVSVDIRFRRRSYGGYYVQRADNGRHLGWIIKNGNRDWTAYVSSGAFRGTSVDDEGDILDHVDEFTVGTLDRARRVAHRTETREDAAQGLVSFLWDNFATAVTGQPSPHCTPYKR